MHRSVSGQRFGWWSCSDGSFCIQFVFPKFKFRGVCRFVSKAYSVLFYKHHDCILYPTACIYIYHSMYYYMYHSMYIICTTACIYYIPLNVYMYHSMYIIIIYKYTTAGIHIPQHVYTCTCNYNEWGMHVQWYAITITY